ncbi:PREDICTED: UPF0434 [Prunus dulcis]|uniref:PREDICTED: UPF0434 n=1 Tax=Prunus dulcis TaxID=3755 RepID=A0A5E4E2D0_PRUDU|nr:PREDICTED: UPF0434 [Prunus dulcis]
MLLGLDSARPSVRYSLPAFQTTSKIKDGIPCLVPKDGKTLEADDTLKPEDAVKSSVEHEADQGGSH